MNVVLKANAGAPEKLAGIVRPLREANATLRAISAALNGAGLATARGGRWYPTRVASLLDRLDAGADVTDLAA